MHSGPCLLLGLDIPIDNPIGRSTPTIINSITSITIPGMATLPMIPSTATLTILPIIYSVILNH